MDPQLKENEDGEIILKLRLTAEELDRLLQKGQIPCTRWNRSILAQHIKSDCWIAFDDMQIEAAKECQGVMSELNEGFDMTGEEDY